MELFTNPAGIYCLANIAHTHCTYAKSVLVLGAFARCSAVNSLKSFQIMCLLYSDGKASLLQFLSSVVGPFSHRHIKDPGGYRVGEAKRGGKNPNACVGGR